MTRRPLQFSSPLDNGPSLLHEIGDNPQFQVTRTCNSGFAECHERETDCEIRRTRTRECCSWRF